MFWHAIGLVLLSFGFMAWGLAQYRWTERMLARVNQTRPSDKQRRFWDISHFQVFELHGEFWRVDPRGYPRAMLGFGITLLILLGLASWLLSGLDAGGVSTGEQPLRWPR